MILLLLGRRDAQVTAVGSRTGMKYTSGEMDIHLTQPAPKVQAPGRLLVWGEMALSQREGRKHESFWKCSDLRGFVHVRFCDTER